MAIDEHNAPDVRDLPSTQSNHTAANPAQSDNSECTKAALSPIVEEWLRRYTFLGASVIPQADGTCMFGHPTYHYSPVFHDNEAIYARIIEQQAGSDCGWLKHRKLVDQYMWEGALKELDGLLETVPELLVAVKAIVFSDASRGAGRVAEGAE